jgi:hypothetical protein
VADLQGEPLAGRAAPQASASAHVTPFAALPVSEVLARTLELDLSALSASATSRPPRGRPAACWRLQPLGVPNATSPC